MTEQATIIKLAQGTTDALNGPFQSEGHAPAGAATFNARRRSRAPRYTLEELKDGIKVDVMPRRLDTAEQATTRDNSYDDTFNVSIGITSRIDFDPPDANDAADVLHLLAEKIIRYFRGGELPGVDGIPCIAASQQVPFDPQKADREDIFFTVIVLSFQRISSDMDE